MVEFEDFEEDNIINGDMNNFNELGLIHDSDNIIWKTNKLLW